MGTVLVLSARDTVQPQTETVWRQATKYHVPAIIYVNKMDRDAADFFACLTAIEHRLITISSCNSNAYRKRLTLSEVLSTF